MTTTSIVAEILVVGFQALLWITVAALGLFGVPRDLSSVKDWVPLLTVLVISAAYTLGVIVDRTADFVAHVFLRSADPSRQVAESKRLFVMHSSEGMTRSLEYTRSRWRLARATFLNATLVVVAMLWFRTTPHFASTLTDPQFYGVLALLVVLVAGGAYASRELAGTYSDRLRLAYDVARRDRITSGP